MVIGDVERYSVVSAGVGPGDIVCLEADSYSLHYFQTIIVAMGSSNQMSTCMNSSFCNILITLAPSISSVSIRDSREG